MHRGCPLWELYHPDLFVGVSLRHSITSSSLILHNMQDDEFLTSQSSLFRNLNLHRIKIVADFTYRNIQQFADGDDLFL